jgi:hypothetical protein
MVLIEECRQLAGKDQNPMADVNNRSVDDKLDKDPTAELEIIPERAMASEDVTQSDDPIGAANQAFEGEQLDAEIRELGAGVSALSSKLRSRTQKMQSIQRELDSLRDFSGFLRKEVESGKEAVAEVTEDLVSVRAQQNDVSEHLRRRVQQVTVMRDRLAKIQDQLAKKDALIEELTRRLDVANRPGGQEKLGSREVGGDLQAKHQSAAVNAASQNGQTKPSRLRMIVARHGNKMTVHPLPPGGMSLGSGPDNDVQLDDEFVSYRHAVITETAAGYLLKDVGSTNGTWINQQRIKSQVLRHSDRIDLGPVRLEFIDRPVEKLSGQNDMRTPDDPS